MIKLRTWHLKAITRGTCFLVMAILVGAFLTLPLLDGGQSLIGRMSSRIVSALQIRDRTLQMGTNISLLAKIESLKNNIELRTMELDHTAGSGVPVYNTVGFTYIPEIPLSAELQEYTYGRCKYLGLEYEMILAIMWRESMFQHDVVGTNKNGTRDSGLMQVNDVNKGWLAQNHGIENLLDPYQNIDAGTLILSMYFMKYDETQALLCYQYGENGMLKKWEEGMRTNDLTVLVQNKRDEFVALRQRI